MENGTLAMWKIIGLSGHTAGLEQNLDLDCFVAKRDSVEQVVKTSCLVLSCLVSSTLTTIISNLYTKMKWNKKIYLPSVGV